MSKKFKPLLLFASTVCLIDHKIYIYIYTVESRSIVFEGDGENKR